MRGTMRHWPAPRKATASLCGKMVTFFWAGEYQAPCIEPAGHTWQHSDGIASADTDTVLRVLGTGDESTEEG